MSFFLFNRYGKFSPCSLEGFEERIKVIKYQSLSFHAVHVILKARMRKWFAIPFSSGPRSLRTLHRDPSISGGPAGHGS